jgi:hypothetical protein
LDWFGLVWKGPFEGLFYSIKDGKLVFLKKQMDFIYIFMKTMKIEKLVCILMTCLSLTLCACSDDDPEPSDNQDDSETTDLPSGDDCADSLRMSIDSVSRPFGMLIDRDYLESRIKILSDDTMYGRWLPLNGIEKTREFIRKEYASQNLQSLDDGTDFLNAFEITKSIPEFLEVELNNRPISPDSVVVLGIGTVGGFNEEFLNQLDYFQSDTQFAVQQRDHYTNAVRNNQNHLVVVPRELEAEFMEFRKFVIQKQVLTPNTVFVSEDFVISLGVANIVYILSDDSNVDQVSVDYELGSKDFYNIAAVIPGRSKACEAVVFGAHMDHLGVSGNQGDSIWNGANDNASGTAALLSISKYFSENQWNERTLIFIAFDAEEIGLVGSDAYVEMMSEYEIVAAINMDMVGNTIDHSDAYIIAFEESDLGSMIQSGLTGSDFALVSDENFMQSFLNRSDHAPFLRDEIPAVTISTYDGFNFEHYHLPSDEFDLVDVNTTERISNAVILGSFDIVRGIKTPKMN